MKNLFQKLLGVALIACIALSLSSCEELFGEWSKPVPASVVQEAKVLGAALETGAKVSVNYSVGSKNYVATFIKNSDDSYTLISNDYISGARAMTRDASPIPFTVPTGDAAAVGSNIQLVLVDGKLQLTVKDTNGTPLFEAQMNVDGGEVVVLNTNAAGIDCSVGSVAVNDQPQAIKNPEMKSVNLIMSYQGHSVSYAVKYSQENSETWAAVIERYNNLDVVEIKSNEGYISVMFSHDLVVNSLMEGGVEQAIAEEMYTNLFSGEFYLISNNPNPSDARALTRNIAPIEPKYVKTTDVVGLVDGQAQGTYYLTTQNPFYLFITEDTELTGSPIDRLTIIVMGNYKITLNGYTPADGKKISFNSEYDFTIKLKGDNKVNGISTNENTVTIEEATSGATLLVESTETGHLAMASNLTVNSGKATVTAAKATAFRGAVNVSGGELLIKGGTRDDGKGTTAILGPVTVTGGILKVKGGDATGNMTGGVGIAVFYYMDHTEFGGTLNVSGTGQAYVAGGNNPADASKNGRAVEKEITGAYAYDNSTSAWGDSPLNGTTSRSNYISSDNTTAPSAWTWE